MKYAQLEDTVSSGAENGKERSEGTHKKRLLIGRDRWTKTVFAILGKRKGLGDETVVQKATRTIDAWGYRKMIIKTDGEPALVQVQKAIARARVHETICENPPAYDPQSNGGAERAVEEVQNQMRSIKICLEMRLQAPVEAT